MSEADEDTRRYIVLKNDEGQYSLWLERKTIPEGWESVGTSGTKSECMDYVDKVWLDMRPLSLIREMEGSQPQ